VQVVRDMLDKQKQEDVALDAELIQALEVDGQLAANCARNIQEVRRALIDNYYLKLYPLRLLIERLMQTYSAEDM
jgi:hypothetical protein